MPIKLKLPKRQHFSVSQVAVALDVSAASVWRYLRHGTRGRRLPSFLIGGRRRVARADLRRWLEETNTNHREEGRENRREQHAYQTREAEKVEALLRAEGF